MVEKSRLSQPLARLLDYIERYGPEVALKMEDEGGN
jgi:hypothetical protein